MNYRLGFYEDFKFNTIYENFKFNFVRLMIFINLIKKKKTYRKYG